MTPTIFIFGTNHRLQCGAEKCSKEHIENFRGYVREICEAHAVQFVVEEMSEKGLERYDVQSTVARQVAKELALAHEYTDLDDSERSRLHISDGDLAGIALSLSRREQSNRGNASCTREALTQRLSNPIRERYWAATILAKDVWPTLFICGADHVLSVSSILGGLVERICILEYDHDPETVMAC
jgi:predicted methyltransferase